VDELIVALHGTIILALVLIGSGTVVQRRGIEPYRLAVIGDRAVVIALAAVRIAAVVEGNSVFGIEPYRFV